MKITIVGGGNIGTQFAVHCAEKRHEVTVFTSTPGLYNGHLSIVDEQGTITNEGFIKLATADPMQAFHDAELIMVTIPATLMNSIAHTVHLYAKPSAAICVVPGNGGSECAFKKCIERGNAFFGIERVPAVARLIEKGKTVKSTGYRDELHVAAIPRGNVDEFAELTEHLFGIKCTTIPNYLNLTMTPSNPILHTTRLRTLFSDWHDGITYEYVPLFYEEWNNASSELLLACDAEVQSICHAMPDFQLEKVVSLRDHYNSQTADEMTKKISSIPAFKGLKTPTVKVGSGFVPDLHSRYFTADFSYGLVIIKQIADFAAVHVPNIDATLNWYKEIAIEKKEFSYADYGITNLDDLKHFYIR